MNKFDFSGWATKNNVKCSDGRTILKDAFKHSDGKTVPLVWDHKHADIENIIGHALLENKNEGVYAYCSLNNTQNGLHVKELIKHGDITALSIYANQLKQNGGSVLDGAIREVSVVFAGANPEAFIDTVVQHGQDSKDDSEEDVIIYTGEDFFIEHSADEPKESAILTNDNETIKDVFDTLSEKQKTVVYAMIGQIVEENQKCEENDQNIGQTEKNDNKTNGGNEIMKHNVFEQGQQDDKTKELTHSDQAAIFADAKRCGSLRDSVISHGIENMEYLFPDSKNITDSPIFIKRKDGWVDKVMSGVKKSPMSRIKSTMADITEDDARAKGYIKGNAKKDEIFTLLKRTTSPTTIYKKQKLDRDDVIDITDFNVVGWLKQEMRMMLNEEIARAALIGDGRLSSSDDKISEQHVRPIWTDDDLFTVKCRVNVADNATADKKAKEFIRSVLKSRKSYKGSGSPSLFTTEDVLTDCLLMEDNNGRVIYDSIDKLATALRVKEIITVSPMEGLTRSVTENSEVVNLELMGIIVNLNDYNIGADKDGAVNMFDDFDIDYNAYKYLIETRCSGALIRPYSAISVELAVPKKTTT